MGIKRIEEIDEVCQSLRNALTSVYLMQESKVSDNQLETIKGALTGLVRAVETYTVGLNLKGYVDEVNVDIIKELFTVLENRLTKVEERDGKLYHKPYSKEEQEEREETYQYLLAELFSEDEETSNSLEVTSANSEGVTIAESKSPSTFDDMHIIGSIKLADGGTNSEALVYSNVADDTMPPEQVTGMLGAFLQDMFTSVTTEGVFDTTDVSDTVSRPAKKVTIKSKKKCNARVQEDFYGFDRLIYIGGTYRKYDGTLVHVLSLAENEQTGDMFVNYVPVKQKGADLSVGFVSVMPYEEFAAKLDKKSQEKVGQMYKYELIG